MLVIAHSAHHSLHSLHSFLASANHCFGCKIDHPRMNSRINGESSNCIINFKMRFVRPPSSGRGVLGEVMVIVVGSLDRRIH